MKSFTLIIDPSLKKRLSGGDFMKKSLYNKNDKKVEIDGYTGNESATKTTTYHSYVLVFQSVAHEFEYYLKIDEAAAAHSLANSFDAMPKPQAMAYLDRLFKNSKDISWRAMVPMVNIMAKINNLKLARTFISKMPIHCEEAARPLGQAIAAFGLENIEDLLTSLSGSLSLNRINTACKLVKVRFIL